MTIAGVALLKSISIHRADCVRCQGATVNGKRLACALSVIAGNTKYGRYYDCALLKLAVQIVANPARLSGIATTRAAGQTSVEADPTAPSKPNVLNQTGNGTFPWCVKKDVVIADGFVEVKLKPLPGKEDQAGGVVWRWESGDSYYLARVNALENNVTLYYVKRGQRHELNAVDVEVRRNVWQTLRVEFDGARIRVVFNGKLYIETDDRHIGAPGAVGVWTKADSVTAFDDFTYDGKP
ncbi:hypothetical protein LMG28614_05817 [Paraburkholderia ultramafica]|uniref:3-keto-alpha-glucoside-1,2-lyase/3-keto-2-hydroxy-glucal hydratase domain-containing protein n=1 Tax=Paraburkholderia ultramafica TaxID=1544867 RepID=A0A6S7BYU1_9BURK|nr:family 16 glycoside hydrolase [Paraburkholderia ultramafica]CAB3803423.1 hypothetical protein LMG28614_05817 [Paraburkholderia ultramafica]